MATDLPRHDQVAPGYAGQLYDSHAHLVSDDLVRYPRKPMRASAAGSSAAPSPFGPGMVGQPGGFHGPNPVNEKPTAEQMRKWMAEENVCGIAAVQKGMIYGTDNSYIVDAAELFPDLMRAVIIVDPQAPGTPQMMHEFAQRGIVGIRFFGVGVQDKRNWLSSPEALKVWQLADELGVLVDIEAPPVGGEILIPVIEEMADRFPGLTIVLDHILMPAVTEADFGIGPQFDGLAKRPNIFVKFTSLNMDVIREQGVDPAAFLRRAVSFFGAAKVMWGSDIGTSSGTYKEMVARGIAATALLSPDERLQVLHDTGRRVFGGWAGSVDGA